MRINRLFLSLSLIGVMAALPVASRAAAYDDEEDDIYYNPKKETPRPAPQPARSTASTSAGSYVPSTVPVVNYPGADTYSPSGPGLDMDVDAYNRRGASQVPDSISLDQLEQLGESDTYNYTRRLERYHNPDIVNGSGNQSLIDSYYSTQSPAEVNLYVVNPVGYFPYYNWGWYSPWYGPRWSLSWNWGWGYDPWYDWSWGWGPSWSYPGWGYPGWGYPGWGWGGGWGPAVPPRPSYSWSTPGAARPHHPTAGGSSSTAARRPGAFSAGASNAARPGSFGTASGTSQRRPGSMGAPSQSGSRQPSTTGGGSYTGGRGRATYTPPTQQTQQSRQRQSTPSYNQSRPSWGGGGGNYGGGGGGRSGGGGTRGRGR